MLIVRNRLLPIGRRYAAINLFGILFVKPGVQLSPTLLQHEAIHSRQMRELLWLPFYVAYVFEWLWWLLVCRGNAYRAYINISHEREAYAHQSTPGYLTRRRTLAQWRRS